METRHSPGNRDHDDDDDAFFREFGVYSPDGDREQR